MTAPSNVHDDERRRAIDVACARHSVEHSHVTVVSSTVILVVCYLLFRGRVPDHRLFAWAAVVTIIILLRVALALAYRRRVPNDAELGPWVSALALSMTASAFVWGGLVFVPIAPDNGLTMTVAIIFVGAVAGAVQMLIGTPRICAAVIVGHLGPLFVYLVRSGVREHVFLAAATAVFLVFVTHVAMQNRRLLRSSIALKFGNLDLVERLTEEKTRAEEARTIAERATAAKDQFLAAASHDIRQPIHAAFMFLGAVEEASSSALVEPVTGLRTSLVAARQMLDSLLDVSRIDAGVVERHDVPSQAAVLAARIAAIMRPVAERRELELRIHAPAGLWFESDPVLCQIILMNLMSNALKYTTRGGVLLSFRRAEGRCRVQVWDTGIGIPADEHERIFDDFRQLDNPERDRSRGIGLGLSIARRLARVLDTSIGVRSVVGRGSVFALDLPLGAAPPMSVEAAPIAHSTTSLRILVVDDDEMSRAGLGALLHAWGHEVVTAGNVEEAGDVAGRHPDLDVALVDYRLPSNKTGHDAVAAVTAALGRPIDVIFITGDTTPQRIREASAGQRVVFKPVPPDVLRDALTSVLARACARQTIAPTAGRVA